MATSRRRGSPSSTPDSRPVAEALDLDALPFPTPEESDTLERCRPGPMTLPEYAKFLKQFHWTEEQLRAIPTHEGIPPFTLDD